jgi:hypothetical protein
MSFNLARLHVPTAIRWHSGAQFDMQHLRHHSPYCVVVIRLVLYGDVVRPVRAMSDTDVRRPPESFRLWSMVDF